MVIFTVLVVLGAIRAWRFARQTPPTAGSPQTTSSPVLNYGREIGTLIASFVVITVVALGVSQLVPVSRTNPPVQTTLQWDSAQTKDLAYRACMDCHSNETAWPWYDTIAPASWLAVSHINDGRRQMNLSELNNVPAARIANMTNDIQREIQNGTMPTKDYALIHQESRLTAEERQKLIQGFQATLAKQAAAAAAK